MEYQIKYTVVLTGQVNQLASVGIAATQAGSANFLDVAEGKYRFGGYQYLTQ